MSKQSVINEFLKTLKDGAYKLIDSSIETEPKTYSAVLPMCIDRMIASELQYKEIEPKEGTFDIDNGFKISRYSNGDICGRPHMLRKDGEHIVSVDYDRHSIFYYDDNFNLYKKYYTADNSHNRYPKCLAITEDRIFVGTVYNRVICIDKNTKDVLWEFGEYNRRGKCSDGKIGRPTNIEVLSNGNIVVSTYDGVGDSNRYYGTLEEFDKDGNWVKTLLQDTNGGLGADIQTHYPQSIRIYNDIIYVGKSNEIDVFNYNNGDLEFIQTIRKPSNAEVEDLNLKDFVIEDGILYIISTSIKKVVGFDTQTQQIVFSSGHFRYEGYANSGHEGNALNYPYGLMVEDGKIYVADTSNYQIIEVFRNDYTNPQYELPQNIDLIYTSQDLDEDFRTNVPIGVKPDNLHIVYKEKLQ